MNPLKISGLFLVSAVVLIGSWFIFKASFSSPANQQNQPAKTGFLGTGVENPFANIDLQNAKEFLSQQLSSALSPSNETATSTENLTEQIGKAMSSKILSGSEDLLNYKSGELSSEEKLIADELANQLNNQNYLPLNQPINEKTLKIGDDSLSAKKQYIENLGIVVKNCFSGFTKSAADILKDTIEKNDPTSAKKLSEIYSCAYNGLISAPAPSSWLDFHKDLLVYYQNAKIIYEAITGYQSDPLKAYIAVSSLENLIDSAKQIQTILEIKAKSVGL